MKILFRSMSKVLALTALLLLCGCGNRDVLLQEPFADRGGNWGEDRRDEFERGYEGGEYFIEVVEPYWFAWASAGKSFDDVSIEVEAYLDSGSPDNHFGVLCRQADQENFYYFAISSDGYYAIFRSLDGEVETLTGDGMLPSSAVRTDGQTNRIQAVCRGDRLSLYVNDQLVASTRDGALARGDVGIGVGAQSTGGVRVHFDDLVVRKP